jgi:hypothetical protein
MTAQFLGEPIPESFIPETIARGESLESAWIPS